LCKVAGRLWAPLGNKGLISTGAAWSHLDEVSLRSTGATACVRALSMALSVGVSSCTALLQLIRMRSNLGDVMYVPGRGSSIRSLVAETVEVDPHRCAEYRHTSDRRTNADAEERVGAAGIAVRGAGDTPAGPSASTASALTRLSCQRARCR